MKQYKITFLYPTSKVSPNPVHLDLANLICQINIRTPLGPYLTFMLKNFTIPFIPKSDILFLESAYSLPFAFLYKAFHPKCKIILIQADRVFWKPVLSLFRKIFLRIFIKSVDGYITVSYRIKNDIQDFLGETATPIEVLRPFIYNIYSKKNKKFNKNILFVGMNNKHKGFLQLVEAMKFLNDFELYLVGTCCEAVKKHPPNVHLEGRVKSLNDYFEKCTYYVHPAYFDPFPASVLEAMHAGLIPIITKDVGVEEIFTREIQDLIISDNNPKTIADKIREIDSRSFIEKKKLINVCKNIAKNYTKDKVRKRFKKAFYRLVKRIDQNKKAGITYAHV